MTYDDAIREYASKQRAYLRYSKIEGIAYSLVSNGKNMHQVPNRKFLDISDAEFEEVKINLPELL